MRIRITVFTCYDAAVKPGLLVELLDYARPRRDAGSSASSLHDIWLRPLDGKGAIIVYGSLQR